MIILTGGAGFIGSVMLQRLNDEGITDILVVDDLSSTEKWKNLRGKQFNDYCHKDAFPEFLSETLTKSDVDAVIHLGACTSTTERDADYLMTNNFLFSKVVATWCFGNSTPFIYASSAATYGDGKLGFSDDTALTGNYRPLNMYGFSKHVFDQWIIRNNYENLCIGFKFFNVFGPNEYHKGEMASLVYKAYHQVKETGALKLFKSNDLKYADGEFSRDFIYVKDCVDVLMWSFHHPEVCGIFNLGSGKARTWNDLAASLFAAMNLKPKINFIDMPEDIRDAYQYFTQAGMTKLRGAGYTTPFRELESAVEDYVQTYLATPEPYL